MTTAKDEGSSVCSERRTGAGLAGFARVQAGDVQSPIEDCAERKAIAYLIPAITAASRT